MGFYLYTVFLERLVLFMCKSFMAFRFRRRRFTRRRRPYTRRTRIRRAIRSRRRGGRGTIFKNRRKMRRFNTGGLNFNRILSRGDSLPQTAFGRVTYATGSIRYILSYLQGSNYSAGGQYTSGMRTLCVNDMFNQWDTSYLPVLASPHFRYFGIYNLFYGRYMVLGSLS